MNPEKEKELDETAMAEFKSKWEGTVEYTENEVSNIVEAVLAIGRSGDYDLIVVGKGRFPSKMEASVSNAVRTELEKSADESCGVGEIAKGCYVTLWRNDNFASCDYLDPATSRNIMKIDACNRKFSSL
ncbi:hypothetical protein OIU76_010392 [Salix suchowensis]|nr:hypothetical protein OIU76_010392 [Salix suchowensis]